MQSTEYSIRAWILLVLGVLLIVIGTPLMTKYFGPEGGYIIIVGIIAIAVSGLNFLAASHEEKKVTGKVARALNLHDVLQKMATSYQGIDLKYLAREVGIKVVTARLKLFDLIKSGRISGTLVENEYIFRPAGDIPQVINTVILELQKK